MSHTAPPPDQPEWRRPDDHVPDDGFDLPPAPPLPPPRGGSHGRGPRKKGDPEFRRTMLLTVAGTLVPGVGLIAARRHLAGLVVFGLFLTGIVSLAILAGVDRQALLSFAVDPEVLRGIGVALVVLALVWVGVVIASHLALRGPVTSAQRATGGALVGVLAFAVAAPMAVASIYSYEQASLVGTVFKSEKDSRSATRPTLNVQPSGTESQDPWADKPRLNILLLGGDADAGRNGTRTDTVILASIDTRTGDTTLFSLPRQTARMPFPKRSPLHRYYPNGFTNGDGNNHEYFLNAMYRNVPATVPKDVLGETDDLGADALKLSVGAALDLKVDYYVLIELQGFVKLINALGGIRVNVNTYIPIGGNDDRNIPPLEQISPGEDKKLTGRQALWFARGRYQSDNYARMDRQRCVINAIIKQANPATVLTRYEALAKAGKQIVQTDVPQEVLPILVDLSLRVKEGNVRSIVFKSGVAGFEAANPDFAEIHRRVRVALDETAGTKPSPSATPSPDPSSTATKKPKPKKSPTADSESEDVEAGCAWQPEVAAQSRPFRGATTTV